MKIIIKYWINSVELRYASVASLLRSQFVMTDKTGAARHYKFSVLKMFHQ
jgi:hypothetical protein